MCEQKLISKLFIATVAIMTYHTNCPGDECFHQNFQVLEHSPMVKRDMLLAKLLIEMIGKDLEIAITNVVIVLEKNDFTYKDKRTVHLAVIHVVEMGYVCNDVNFVSMNKQT